MNTIWVIRHGEKPDNGNQGVNAAGASDEESLTPRGWQRARWLYFFGSKGILPAPDRIYAASPGKEKVAPHEKIGSKSRRPLETVTPLALKLQQAPIQKYTKGDETSLVKEIVALQGTTLVCWQHEAIPDIANLIVGSMSGIPDQWPGDRFDVVWRFTRANPGKGWVFDQVCQCLLAGDRKQPIG